MSPTLLSRDVVPWKQSISICVKFSFQFSQTEWAILKQLYITEQSSSILLMKVWCLKNTINEKPSLLYRKVTGYTSLGDCSNLTECIIFQGSKLFSFKEVPISETIQLTWKQSCFAKMASGINFQNGVMSL